MNKQEHGELLAKAMGERGVGRQEVADRTGVAPRTVTNWTSGATMPSERERAILRQMVGDYERPGDAVERAIRISGLDEWRQDAVLSFYKRNLHEQAGERAVG